MHALVLPPPEPESSEPERKRRWPFFVKLGLSVLFVAAALVAKANAKGIAPGLALGRFDEALADTLLVSISEVHRKADIDTLASTLDELARSERSA